MLALIFSLWAYLSYSSFIFSHEPDLFPIKRDYVRECMSEQFEIFTNAHLYYDTYVLDDYCRGKYRKNSLVYCNNFCGHGIDMMDVEESFGVDTYNYCVKTCIDLYDMDFP